MTVRAHIEHAIDEWGYRFLLNRVLPDGKQQIGRIVWEDHAPGSYVEVNATPEQEMKDTIRAICDAAGRLDLLPSSAPLKAHLEDMRKLAFQLTDHLTKKQP